MLARVYYSKVPVLRFAVEDVLEQLIEDRFYRYKDFDLAIVSLSPKVYPIDGRTVETFDEYFGRDKWIAFHSITSFANEKTVEDALVVLFIKFTSGGHYHIYTAKRLTQNYENLLKETAEYLNQYAKKNTLNLIFATFSQGRSGFFIEDLGRYLRNTVNVIGGVASGIELPSLGTITYIYTSDGIVKDGFAILTLENVEYSFGLAFGYRILGPVYTITRAETNRVLEIDHESVEGVLKKLSKGISERDIKVFWYSPIVILDEKEGWVSILRSFKHIPPDKSYIEFYGPIKEGWKFRFSFGLKEELLKADTEEAIKVQKALGDVELGFNFSCVARQFVLEDLHEEEAKRYSSIFNAPLFGFFTLGEIGPDRTMKKLKYYNQTSVVVGVREL